MPLIGQAQNKDDAHILLFDTDWWNRNVESEILGSISCSKGSELYRSLSPICLQPFLNPFQFLLNPSLHISVPVSLLWPDLALYASPGHLVSAPGF